MKQALFFLLRLYHAASFWLPSSCIYVPSCSEYARVALERHSLGKALWYIMRRIFKCHPGTKGGYDPVPE